MKVTFEYNGELILIKIPKYLAKLHKSLDGLYTNIVSTNDEIFYDEVESYIEAKLLEIFAEYRKIIDTSSLTIEYYEPSTSYEKSFGALISIIDL